MVKKQRSKYSFESVRPFLYFDHLHIFDLFCTSTEIILRSILRPKLYFELNLTSTFLAKLYFDQNGISTKTVLRPKRYFDQNGTSTCTSRPIRNPDLTEGRSKERVEDMKKVPLRTNDNSFLLSYFYFRYLSAELFSMVFVQISYCFSRVCRSKKTFDFPFRKL